MPLTLGLLSPIGGTGYGKYVKIFLASASDVTRRCTGSFFDESGLIEPLFASLGLVIRFGFGSADCSGAGVGFSGISEIAAGSRCAELSNATKKKK